MLLSLLISTAAAVTPWAAPTPPSYGGAVVWEGDRIAVTTGDGQVLTYSADGQRLTSWKVHKWGVEALSMSADGRRLLTVDYGGEVEVWDTDTGDRLARWKPSGRWSTLSARIAPDGQHVLMSEQTLELRPLDGGPATVLWGADASNSELIGFIGERVYAPSEYSGVGTWGADGQQDGARVPLLDPLGRLTPAGDDLLHMSWEGALLRVDLEAGAAERLSVPGLGPEQLAVSPDGGRLAFPINDPDYGDPVVAVYDLEAKRHLPALPTATLLSLDWSPDGTQLVLLGLNQLHVVDAPAPDAPDAPLTGEAPLTLGVTEDGQQLVAIYADGGVWSWWIDGGELAGRGQVPLGGGYVAGSVVLRPGAREAALVDPTGALITWDLAADARLKVLLPQSEGALVLRYGADGSLVATSYDRGLLWSPEGEPTGQLILSGVDQAAPGPGGASLAISTSRGDVSVIDAATGDIRWTKATATYTSGLHWLPDGSVLVVDGEGQPKRFDAADGAVRDDTPGLLVGAGAMTDVITTAVSPDGATLALSGEEGDLVTRMLPTTLFQGEVVHAWPWDYELGYTLLAVHPDGERLLTADRLGALQLWDPGAEEGGPLQRTYAAPQPGALAVTGDTERLFIARAEGLVTGVTRAGERIFGAKFDAEVMDLSLSPDGTQLLVGLSDGGLVLLSALTGEPAWELSLFEWVTREVRFSPDGRWVAALDDYGNLGVLDAATGKPAPGYSPPWWVSGFAWDSQSRLLAFSDAEGVLTWTEAGWTGRKLRRRKGWSISGALTVCDDDLALARSSYSGGPAVYRAPRGAKGRLRGSALEAVDSVAMACDGQHLILVPEGGDAWVLDAEEGAFQRGLSGDGSKLSDVELLPDGVLATSSLAGRVRLWDPATGALLLELEERDEPHPPAPPPPPAQLAPDGEVRPLGVEETMQRLDAVFEELNIGPEEAPDRLIEGEEASQSPAPEDPAPRRPIGPE